MSQLAAPDAVAPRPVDRPAPQAPAELPTWRQAVAAWVLKRLAPVALPNTIGLTPEKADPKFVADRKQAHAEVISWRGDTTEALKSAEASVYQAERHYSDVRSLFRLGKADEAAVRDARAALEEAERKLADVRRDANGQGHAIRHLERCKWIEQDDRMQKNRPKLIEALQRYADAYAIEEQLRAQLREAEAAREQLVNAVLNLAFIHPESPPREHGSQMLSLVRDHVDATLNPPKPAVPMARLHPDVEKVRARERAIVDAARRR